MDIETIGSLAKLLDKYNLTKLEVSEKDTKYTLERSDQNCGGISHPASDKTRGNVTADDSIDETRESSGSDFDGVPLLSKLVGTVYLSAGNGKPPFVSVGKKVKRGDTVCIIEAMKMLNEIHAESEGTVSEICVGDGASVEFGQPIIVIK